MSTYRARKPLTSIILISFSLMTLFHGYGYGQSDNPLVRAQALFSNGQYDEAVSILQEYIGETKEQAAQQSNLAAAWYLLAKIYYEVGDDPLCDEALLKVYGTLPGFDRDEPNFGLRERVTKIKAKLAGSIPATAENAQAQKTATPASETKSTPVVTPLESKPTEPLPAPKDAEVKITPVAFPVETKATEPLPAPADTETKVAAISAPAETKTAASVPAKIEPTIIEKPKKDSATVQKKKKKFPWLLAIAVTLVVGVAVYYFVVVNKKYTLTTTIGTGVNGTPAAGSVKYKKGSVVNYSFAAASGYMDLVVTLDGTAVATSGTMKMDKNHALSATAVQFFLLTVTRSNGVNGTPETGTYIYPSGTSVSYSYAEISGYKNLVVKIDDVAAATSGAIIMNGNHTLTASATAVILRKLTVTAGWRAWDIAEWNPGTGTYYFNEGTEVHWSYLALNGGLRLILNGIEIFGSYPDGNPHTYNGSFILNGDWELSVNAP